MVYYLGIDIGASKIKVVLMKGFGAQKPKHVVFDTPRNKTQFLKLLEKFIHGLQQGVTIKGIGLGLPGIVDRKRGVLIKAPNLPFLDGWDATKFFKKFKIPIRVDNDSRCFLRAEALLGAGRGYKNIVALTVGTGIGGGIVIDGRVYNGSRNGAGEFGHMVLERGKTFEQLAGKKAFLKYGDRSEVIGKGVANLINAFDPDSVILGGGGVTSGAVKIDTVGWVAKRYIMSPLAKKTPIVKGKLGDAAAAIGAALLWKKGY